MTLRSTIFPERAILLGRKWFKTAGAFNQAVPSGAKWCMAHLAGCGGFGDQNGGGAAYVRTRFPVTPAENLTLQVGSPSTQTVAGDSFVKRGTTTLAYADRGRGNGTPGSVELSVGEIRRAGAPPVGSGYRGGPPGDDAEDPLQLFGDLLGLVKGADTPSDDHAAHWGGGGRVWYYNAEGGGLARPGYPGGSGVICLEWFDKRPKLA